MGIAFQASMAMTFAFWIRENGSVFAEITIES